MPGSDADAPSGQRPFVFLPFFAGGFFAGGLFAAVFFAAAGAGLLAVFFAAGAGLLAAPFFVAWLRVPFVEGDGRAAGRARWP
jgi:hypothetical protein